MPKPQLSDALSDFNLHQAWSKVYENQGCAGVDGQTLMDFAGHLMANLDTLRNEARYGTYRPQPLLRVAIDKPSGGKVQYSVFECHLTDPQRDVLRALLLEMMDGDDSLRWYPLCAWCSDGVFFQGVGLPPDDERFFLQ